MNTEPSDPEIVRAAVATTQSIIDHLKTVEEKLHEVIVALGLQSAGQAEKP